MSSNRRSAPSPPAWHVLLTPERVIIGLCFAIAMCMTLVISSSDVDVNAAQGLVMDGLHRDDDGPCKGLYSIGNTGLCTHGPEPAPPGYDIRVDVPPSTRLLAGEARPWMGEARGDVDARDAVDALNAPPVACVDDGTSGKRVQLMYVYASDKPDRYDQYLDHFQTRANWSNDYFSLTSGVYGGLPQRIRYVHDADCLATVVKVMISPAGDDSFSNTISEVQAQGFTASNRKYVMFVDANVYCGIANKWNDDQPGQGNLNNGGPSYIRLDAGCWIALTLTHEVMHTLGAVQISAPHYTTINGGHCTDHLDLMCVGNATPVCDFGGGGLLDCMQDDYYSLNPTPGTYIDTHWNIVDAAYLVVVTLTPTPTPSNTPTPTATATPTPPPGDCNGDYAIDAADVSAQVLEIFDGDGNDPAAVPGGSFPGHPNGCNPNRDGAVDAGDLACVVSVIHGDGTCTQ